MVLLQIGMIAAVKFVSASWLVVIVSCDNTEVHMGDVLTKFRREVGKDAHRSRSCKSKVVGFPQKPSAFNMESFAGGQKMDGDLVALRFLLIRQVLRCEGGQRVHDRGGRFHSELKDPENNFHGKVRSLIGHRRTGLALEGIGLLHVVQ